MGIEIERKFLVNKKRWDGSAKGVKHYYRQGYLSTDPARTVRIRLTSESGFITIKGLSEGAARPEYEYRIPKTDAAELLENLCISDFSKWRHQVKIGTKTWEVDEFTGLNEGLIIAEIELSDENEEFELPHWIDKEVTGMEEYYNSNLSIKPYGTWIK